MIKRRETIGTATRTPRRGLGELLVEQNLITSRQLQEALEMQQARGGRLGEILVGQGLIGAEELAQMISIQLNIPLVNLRRHMVQPDALGLVPEAIARKYRLIPLNIIGDSLVVVMADPEDIRAIEDLRARTGMRVEVALGAPADIAWAIDASYRSGDRIEKQVRRVAPEPSRSRPDLIASTPIAESVDLLIEQAVRDRASDIHLEPQAERLRVRYRIDGVLRDVYSLSTSAQEELVSRIKVLAGMDIAQQRLPQDGQFSIRLGDREIDIRVAAAGTAYGERVTLRILDKFQAIFTLPELGMLPEPLEKYRAMLNCPFGMIVVGGPTGSGKTTTLYTSLNQLDSRERNILTIEDPIEYRFDNISQTQVNLKAGVTFAGGLRAMLRQDPDVILVGEIRDGETATTAVQASITGHLVLTSVHAHDAVSVLLRLLDLCDEPALVSLTLVGIVAQRMVRRICPNCRETCEPTAEERRACEEETESAAVFYRGKGCHLCGGTGYKGRIGLFEVMLISEEIRQMLLKGAIAGDIKAQALKEGMITMKRDGMLKVVEGITTVSEVLRSVFSIGAGSGGIGESHGLQV